MIQNAIVANNFTDRARVFPYGVSSHVESFDLAIDKDKCDGNFPVSAHKEPPSCPEQIRVQLNTLGTFLNRNHPIDIIKIDTEGNEQKVLQGAMHFFERKMVRDLVVEVPPALLSGTF